jgi:integrase
LKYPVIGSISSLDSDKSLLEWKEYLAERIPAFASKRTTPHVALFRTLIRFYSAYYDDRDEFVKDRWDVRNIPGAQQCPLSASNSYLNFTKVPADFQPMMKRLLKRNVFIKSIAHCNHLIQSASLFLQFVLEIHPDWKDLSMLSRKDMEECLSKFHKHKTVVGWTNTTLNARLTFVRIFLEKIQLFGYPEAPVRPFFALLFKEDIPRADMTQSDEIKYIPEEVLKQLEDNIEHLPPYAIPIVILLRMSGWRISDVLNLRYDACLDRTPRGWYLVGDIIKTKILGHRIPISDEDAAIILTFIEAAKAKRNNPQKFLHVQSRGTRKGLPPTSGNVLTAMDTLATKQNITDNSGKLFKFGNHAFRHTKGVELINNGMNILHVQKWLAHLSPRMTLTYAKILDTTMRKSWEEATKNGLFKVDRNGTFRKVDVSEIENEDIIEWEYIRHNLDAVRMPLGYCMKPKKLDCSTQLNPCLTCHNLCTTPDFIPQFELEIMETKKIIEKGTQQGRTVWVEKNQSLLNRLVTVADVLKTGKIHHKLGKQGREYLGDERNSTAKA